MKSNNTNTEHLAPGGSRSAPKGAVRLTSGGLASLLLACAHFIPAQGAPTPSTWNSPTDYDPEVWEYDSAGRVWRDKTGVNQGRWGLPPEGEPLWDDDDFIFAWEHQVHVLDHDLRYKHMLQPLGGGAQSFTFTPDGMLRYVDPAGGIVHDWTRSGPYRLAGITPQQDHFRKFDRTGEIKFAPDGRFFAAGTLDFHAGSSAGVHELALQVHKPVSVWGYPWGGEFGVINRWYGEQNRWFTGLAIVPDSTYPYTIWVSDCEGMLYRLRPDLTDIPYEQGGRIFHPDNISSLHYDPSTHSVLAGRNKIGDTAVFELDPATGEIRREFKLPQTTATPTSGLTRGPNGTVVAIMSSAGPQPLRIHQWAADGTFLRSVGLWEGRTQDLDTGGIIWAGHFRGNHPPEVECFAPAIIPCSPRGTDVELTVTAVDHDPEQKLSITVRVADLELTAEGLPSTFEGVSVPFHFKLPVGDHDIQIEVSDGLVSSFCSSSVSVQKTGAPTVVHAPADLKVEHPKPASFAELEFVHPCNLPFSVTYVDETLPVSGKEVKKVRRTWTATEKGGLSTIVTQTLTWVDTTPPTIEGAPKDLTVIAASSSGTVVKYAPVKATDALGVAQVTYSHPSLTRFPIGTTQVYIKATDRVGNAKQVTFLVSVATADSLFNEVMDPIRRLQTITSIRNQLLSRLTDIKAQLKLATPQPTITALQAFDADVESLKNHKLISDFEAARLLHRTKVLKDALQWILDSRK